MPAWPPISARRPAVRHNRLQAEGTMATPSESEPRQSPSDEPYIDDGRLRLLLNRSAIAIMLVVTALIVWSVVTPVDEVARAPGAIAPEGQVQLVDARDGGWIREVMVHEGQKVAKGAPLLRFDRIRAEAALAVSLAKKVALELSIERLTAFMENRAPDFANYAVAYPGLVARETAA